MKGRKGKGSYYGDYYYSKGSMKGGRKGKGGSYYDDYYKGGYRKGSYRKGSYRKGGKGKGKGKVYRRLFITNGGRKSFLSVLLTLIVVDFDCYNTQGIDKR